MRGRFAIAWVIAAAFAGVSGMRVAHAQPPHFQPGEIPEGTVEEQPPRIELLTFGVGARIFEKYGHAALCLLYNQSVNQPVCFNYGVTDFDATAALAWNFLRTNQRFWVEPDPRDGMIEFYTDEDRAIYSQILPLTGDQARSVEAALWTSTLPAHRYYYYDHFFDNCTTRLRDMLDVATAGKLRAGGDRPYPFTFRQLGLRGVAEFPLFIALSDFYIGRQLDDTPTYWQAMFHPDMLREQVAEKFGVAPVVVNARRGPPFPTSGPTDRWVTILIALLFGAPLWLARRWPGRARLQRAAMALATIELAFWGITIWSIVILSSIAGLRWNEAVFVFVPFDIALPWLSPARRRIYARGRLVMVLAVSLLVAIGVFHQPLWIPVITAFIPLGAIAFA
jgi:hypothetical protein